ncbi:hypothetical protein BBK36DRAFT_1139771 [Trichoderma citrinoviride]|uniref:Uncharacterized protein n=1 Tax=Trichoderma citrinoviride TaxID=58853 RepID=A0A2T4BG23_9HYPO|nr:hypothetical protein BBK36DRAFT_1139771 [Trichoderma citrinoviride]PTB68273.1 hypothetical protein BBK36DRAFT_1139771 [Trichoderma citrinoviride]
MPHFDQTPHGWNPPVKITLPTAYEQYKARNRTVEDPFAACARNDIPPPGVSPYDDNGTQQSYASAHPSLSKWSTGRNLTPSKHLKLDRDEGRSDWETIVGDDEGDSRLTCPPAPQVTLKSLGIIPNNSESILADQNGDGINEHNDGTGDDAHDLKRKGEEAAPFARPGTPFDAFGFSKSPEGLEPRSLAMEASYTPSPAYCGHTGFVRQPVHGGLGGGLSRPKASKASSDESTDLFKYDGEAYSTFLHRSTTREIAKGRPAASYEGDRLIVKKTRGEEEDNTHKNKSAFYNPTAVRGLKTLYEPTPEQSPEPAVEEEEEEECWPRVGGNDAAAEADWQTVTTGPVCKGLNTSELNLIKDTGSSLADVSDIVEEELTPVEYRRAAGAISHQRNQSIHRPKGFYAEGFAQPITRMNNNNHASTVDHRPQNAFGETARAAVPRVVNPFQTPPSWKSTGRVVELDDSPEQCTCKGKGKAVDVNVDIKTRADAPPLTRTESTETVWPQVPRRDETVNDFDQAFCETRVGDTTLPSDDSANVFSRLPFSLIDLKEAAKTHGSQRYRSTDEANTFAQRARLGPLWSGSPTEAGPSSGAYRFGGSDNPPLERPSTAVFRDQITRGRPTHQFDSIEDSTPSPSSAILGSLRSKVNLGSAKKKEKPACSLDPFKAAAALGAKCLRIKAPAKKKDQWPTARNQTGGVLTPSEAELIESARGEIMDRRRCPEKLEKKRTLVFILIMASSIVFPFIGFIALIHKFDSTVAWFTYGEIKDFTKEQRGMLLQQLLVELFVYSIVIIFVALHTSHRI